jgi:hypothetical protein
VRIIVSAHKLIDVVIWYVGVTVLDLAYEENVVVLLSKRCTRELMLYVVVVEVLSKF